MLTPATVKKAFPLVTGLILAAWEIDARAQTSFQTAAQEKKVSTSCTQFKDRIPALAAEACSKYDDLPAENLNQPKDAALVSGLKERCVEYFSKALENMNVVCRFVQARPAGWPAHYLEVPEEKRIAQAKGNRQVRDLNGNAMGFEAQWLRKFVEAKASVEYARLKYSKLMRAKLMEPIKIQINEEYERGGVPGYSPSPVVLSYAFARAAEADWIERIAISALNETIQHVKLVYDGLDKSNAELSAILGRMASASAETKTRTRDLKAVSADELSRNIHEVFAEEMSKFAAGLAAAQGAEFASNLGGRVAFEGILCKNILHGWAAAAGAVVGVGFDIWLRKDHWESKDTAIVMARGAVWGTVAGVSIATGGTAAAPMGIWGIGMVTLFTVTEVLIEVQRNRVMVARAKELTKIHASLQAKNGLDSHQFARQVCGTRGRTDCDRLQPRSLADAHH